MESNKNRCFGERNESCNLGGWCWHQAFSNNAVHSKVSDSNRWETVSQLCLRVFEKAWNHECGYAT